MGDYLGSVALPSMKMRQRKLCQIKQQPRAAPVYNDSSSFGVRMLEKLGWSEGKGLGKREDGMCAPILPKMKQDAEGFGYAGEKDDHWTQHDQDFNQLLKSLNGEQAPVADEGDVVKMKSLEEKSKNSRARVHYKKFTRGKDLSRASEKDLANIFGKKTLEEVKNQSLAIEEPVDKNVKEDEAEEDETNVIGLTTIKASVSLQDYFKMKMQEKIGQSKQNPIIEQETMDEVEESPPKKKSKKNKKIKETVPVESVANPFPENVATYCEESVKKKKKKSKEENVEIFEKSMSDEVEEPMQEEAPTKKMKRSKTKEQDQCSELHEAPSKSLDKKSKKVKALANDLAVEVDEIIPNETSVTKKQKNKKRKRSDEMVDSNKLPTSSDEVLPEASFAEKTNDKEPSEDNEITCRVKATGCRKM
ncbi:PIN2/TERF1-interacting telomerase inhibitor 1 isoform X2 [Armigeres subalbatus]|uniref:PIN2/TERF1-interacting telomerase inhibitor 1 isoform X2 n=1 Tax=Armigeres subalbatus TaxID=124917 RepID=UPI002ED5527F